MPTVLDVDDDTGKKMKDAGDVLLKNPDGTGIAILHVEDVISFDKEKTANGVYGTNDENSSWCSKNQFNKRLSCRWKN